MKTATHSARYSPAEERANVAVHGVGLLLSVAGLAVLVATFLGRGDAIGVLAVVIFGLSLILLYGASTAYHAVRDPGTKAKLRMLDHSAIFVLIAGTYTPFMVVNLRGAWGWSLLAVIWTLAIVGVVVEMTRLRERRVLVVGLCVLMGWLVVVATRPMLESVHLDGLMLLLLGGVAYTGGIAFYVWRSLPYHHAIWHVFVLAGSVLHFLAVLWFVVPVDRP